MAATVEIVIKGKDQASTPLRGVNSALGDIAKTATGFLTARLFERLAASVVDFGKSIVTSAVKVVTAAAEEQKGVASLAAAVKATGADWDTASQAIERYLASETQRVALDDGKGREALVRLTTATGDYNKAIGLLPLAIDLAAAKNMDLASAAEVVGRVAQGNTSILTRYGIQVRENITAEEALIELHKRFAGQGEAFARTYAGQMQILNIHLGNITENIGGMLLPALTRLTTAFNTVLGPIESATNALAPLFAEALEALATEVLGHGENIGGQLAQGMINAAPYVLAALMTLRSIISYWLEPGSAPNLLPLLTEWGKATAEEWFKGWTQADFGMLRGLTASLRGVLQGMVGEGALKAGETNPILRALRGQIGAALDELKATGGVSEATYAAIRAAGGPAGAAAEDLARAYIRVAGIQQEMATTTDPERTAALAEQLEIAQADLELLQFKLGAMTDESSLLERQLDLMKNIAKSAKDIIKGISEIPAALKEGLKPPAFSLDIDTEEIKRKAEEIRKSVMDTITNKEKWAEVGITIMDYLTKAALEFLMGAVGGLQRLSEGILAWTMLPETQGKMQEVGRRLANDIITGIRGIFGLSTTGESLILNFLTGLGDAIVNLRAAIVLAGRNVAVGFIEGITDYLFSPETADWVASSLIAMMDAALALLYWPDWLWRLIRGQPLDITPTYNPQEPWEDPSQLPGPIHAQAGLAPTWFTRPTSLLVGEAGAELVSVVPRSQVGRGGGNEYHLHIHSSASVENLPGDFALLQAMAG